MAEQLFHYHHNQGEHFHTVTEEYVVRMCTCMCVRVCMWCVYVVCVCGVCMWCVCFVRLLIITGVCRIDHTHIFMDACYNCSVSSVLDFK